MALRKKVMIKMMMPMQKRGKIKYYRKKTVRILKKLKERIVLLKRIMKTSQIIKMNLIIIREKNWNLYHLQILSKKKEEKNLQ